MLLSTTQVRANEVVLPSDIRHLELGGQLDYLEDPSGKLDLNAVSGVWRGHFQPVDKTVPNFGFTHSTYWFKVSLVNLASHEPKWILENRYPPLDHLDVYVVRPDMETIHYRAGDMINFDQRPIEHRNYLFELNLPPNQLVDLYIRVRTESSLQMPLGLYTPTAMVEKNQHEFYAFGLYFGLLLAMLIYNALVFLSIRDISYLHYVHYLFGYILFQLSLSGLAFQYLWPSLPAWGKVATPFFMGIAFFGAIRFARDFLQLARHFPVLDRTGQVLGWVFVGITACAVLLPYSTVMKFGVWVALVASIFEFVCGIMMWRIKNRQALYFMLAWSALLFGVVLYVLKTINVLPSDFVTEYSLQLGSALEVMLLSFALAHRMRLLQDDNRQIHRRAKANLEKRVHQRTRELDHALKKLASANARLRALNLRDGLTGVFNRRYFDHKILKEWERAARGNYSLTLMLLDIDHFKLINDNYGHQAGDHVLQVFAQTIESILKRPSDIVARYGGEEFALILPATNRAGAVQLGEEIRLAISSLRIVYEGRTISIQTSVGLSTMQPDDKTEFPVMIRAADAALYEAKNMGRNRVVAHLPEDAHNLAGVV